MKRLLVPAAALLVSACATQRVAERTPPPPSSTRLETTTHVAMPREAPSRPVQKAIPSAGRLASAQIGNYMDNQESDLRQRLRGARAIVSRTGDDIVLHMSSDVLFGSGGSSVSPDGAAILARVSDVLQHYDRTMVEVDGYSDTTGSAEANMKLSQARANAVSMFLIGRGVAQSRVDSKGFGETRLKIPTGDNVSEPRNRRVEIRIVPHADT